MTNGPHASAAQQSDVSRSDIFASVVAEAGAFYRLLVTVVSSFLGGTLLFLDKICSDPPAISLVVLYIGWLALVVCIILVALVRAGNIRSGRMALESRFKEARKIDQRNRKQTTIATWSLAAGLSCIMVFGAITMSSNNAPGEQKEIKVSKEDTRMHPTKLDPDNVITRSIPFGSVETPQSAEESQSPPTGGAQHEEGSTGSPGTGESESSPSSADGTNKE